VNVEIRNLADDMFLKSSLGGKKISRSRQRC
jgi:hypothetical protein